MNVRPLLQARGRLGKHARKVQLFAQGKQINRLTFNRGKDRPAFTRIEYDQDELSNGRLSVELEIDVPNNNERRLFAGIILRSSSGIAVWGSNNQIHPGQLIAPSRSGVFSCKTPRLPLSSGQYLLSAWLTTDDETFEHKLDIVNLYLDHNPLQANRPAGEMMGFLEIEPKWDFS